MRKVTDFIIEKRNYVLTIFIFLSVVSLYLSTKVNINYYGMLLLIKKLEQCGFTKQELQRIAERLKTETGADLIVTQGGKAA